MPTNSTAVRGLDYLNSTGQVVVEHFGVDQFDLPRVPHEAADLLRDISHAYDLVDYRGDVVGHFRQRAVLSLRAFFDVVKLLLRYDEKARALWHEDNKKRQAIARAFVSF